MSKLIVIIFSFLILVQSFNINIEDISKFSTLIEHASYHQKMYGDDFFEFLSEHYGEEMASHQDKHEEHDNLPFKDSHHVFSNINTSFILFDSMAYQLFKLSSFEVSLDFFYKEQHSVFEKISVFQPPKFA